MLQNSMYTVPWRGNMNKTGAGGAPGDGAGRLFLRFLFVETVKSTQERLIWKEACAIIVT